MANINYVDLNIPEVRLLQDLAGIRHDLQSTKRLVKRLVREYESPTYDSELREALTTTILVQYARAFTSGVRCSLKISDVPNLSAEELAHHEDLIDWRNKHIAHSVNSFEMNVAVAHFNDERVTKDGFISVSVQENRIVGFGADELPAILLLVDAVLDFVNSRVEAEEQSILVLVNSFAPEDVLSWPRNTYSPGGEDPKASRRK